MATTKWKYKLGLSDIYHSNVLSLGDRARIILDAEVRD
jgi:hypothetical protein